MLVALQITSIRYIGSLVLLLLLAGTDMISTQSVFLIFTVTSIVSTMLGVSKSRLNISIRLSTILYIFQKHWSFSKWLVSSAAIQWFAGNAYTLVAGALVGQYVFGIIRLAQNLMGLLHITLLAVENIVPTKARRLYENEGEGEMVCYLSKVGGYIAMLSISQVILTYFFSVWLVNMFVKELLNFENYQLYILVYSLVYILLGISASLKFILKLFMILKVFFSQIY